MAEFRKTKIVCTLGPAVDQQEIMEELEELRDAVAEPERP